jgi:hypothetical protein
MEMTLEQFAKNFESLEAENKEVFEFLLTQLQNQALRIKKLEDMVNALDSPDFDLRSFHLGDS